MNDSNILRNNAVGYRLVTQQWVWLSTQAIIWVGLGKWSLLDWHEHCWLVDARVKDNVTRSYRWEGKTKGRWAMFISTAWGKAEEGTDVEQSGRKVGWQEGILSEEPWLGRCCTSPLFCAQYLHLWMPENTKNAKQRHLVDPYVEEAMWKDQSMVKKNQSKVKMEISTPEAHVRAGSAPG